MTTCANITNIASGYSSGHTTVSKFRDTHNAPIDCKTYARCSWEGLKTAVKVHQLVGSSYLLIWSGYSLWAVSYTFSSIWANKKTYSYEQRGPNALCSLTPSLILITRVALTAFECVISPYKGVSAVVSMIACAAIGRHPVLDDVLPIAASVSVFVFGDRMSKAIIVAETVAALLCSQPSQTFAIILFAKLVT